MLTLNLIPPQVKHDVQTSASYRHWLRALIILTVGGCIATAILLATWQLMQRHARTTRQGLVTLQQQQRTNAGTDLTTTTSSLNTTIKILSSALGTPRSWGRDASIVLSSLPTGVTISELSFQPVGKFRLVGIADSRQTFVALDEALKKNVQLQQVTTSSTASKRTAVPFDYTGLVVTEGAGS